MCECGVCEQTLFHILYECPKRPCHDLDLLSWKVKPLAYSHALLCPQPLEKPEVRLWRRVCSRALALLSNLQSTPISMDWKGHIPVLDSTSQYCLCIRCFVVRKARDAKFLAVKECQGDLHGHTCAEGEYMKHRDHMHSGWL